MARPTNTIGRTTGAVYVEFLVVFWPIMMLWLGMAQIGLMYAAHMMVHHAAVRAARAAIVILPDDKEGWEDLYAGVEAYRIGTGGSGLEAYETAPAGGRLDGIRRAARIPLATVSPSLGVDAAGAIGKLLVGYLWTEFGVAVTFPDGDGGYLTSFDDPTGQVTVRVTYLYKCPVPLVNRIICRSYWGADSFFSADTIQKLEDLGAFIDISTSFGSGLDPDRQQELATVGGELLGAAGFGLALADMGFDIGGGGWRFLAMTAEKTLPLQGKH
ncbi:MAG: TadE/TadG family type IV pilus assembly protein [Myxococcota bacterium]|nr:TadE/TadG family type IV pilus assembly protein [Myxococcota bacterium]